MAVTVPPGGVAALCVTSTVTPTDNSPSASNGRSSRAAASSMRATMREVAKTAGNVSPGSRDKALARSVSRTT